MKYATIFTALVLATGVVHASQTYSFEGTAWAVIDLEGTAPFKNGATVTGSFTVEDHQLQSIDHLIYQNTIEVNASSKEISIKNLLSDVGMSYSPTSQFGAGWVAPEAPACEFCPPGTTSTFVFLLQGTSAGSSDLSNPLSFTGIRIIQSNQFTAFTNFTHIQAVPEAGGVSMFVFGLLGVASLRLRNSVGDPTNTSDRAA